MTPEEYRSRRQYYRTVALDVGIPPRLLEDATQDIFERVIRSGADFPTAIRRAAIDAVRRYVGDKRHAPRPELVSADLHQELRAHAPDHDRILDFRRAWERLPATKRALLEGELERREPAENLHRLRVHRARRELRALM